MARYVTETTKGSFISVRDLRRYRVHRGGRAWQQAGERDGHMMSILRKLKELNADALSSHHCVDLRSRL